MRAILAIAALPVLGCTIQDVTLAVDASEAPDAPRGIDASIDADIDAPLPLETFGFFTEFGETVNLRADLTLGRKISVPNGRWTVRKLAAITRGGSGEIALGLYTNNGADEPGMSLALTAAEPVGVGVNELDAVGSFDTASTTNDLWVLIASNAMVPLAGDTTILADSCSADRTFGDNHLPAGNFGSAFCTEDSAINLYVILTQE